MQVHISTLLLELIMLLIYSSLIKPDYSLIYDPIPLKGSGLRNPSRHPHLCPPDLGQLNYHSVMNVVVNRLSAQTQSLAVNEFICSVALLVAVSVAPVHLCTIISDKAPFSNTI